MDVSAELRYYEIRFIKLINTFHVVYTVDKLITFIEMLTFIADANLTNVQSAMQKVLMNDPVIRIHREEYVATLKLFSGFNNTQIRDVAKCSPNTIVRTMKDYEEGKLYITHKFTLEQSNDIKKIVQSLDQVSNIY